MAALSSATCSRVSATTATSAAWGSWAAVAARASCSAAGSGCRWIRPRASEGVEHRARGVTPPHRQRQLGVLTVGNRLAGAVGAGEAVHRLQCQAGGRVDLSGGEVEDAAAADRGELVAVPQQRQPRPGLVGDGEQGAGGVLVEHARPRRRSADRRAAAGSPPPGPVWMRPVTGSTSPRTSRVHSPSLVPAPAVGEDEGRRRPGGRADLRAGDLGGLQRRGDHHQPPPLPLEQVTGSGQRGGLARPGRALHDDQPPVAGQGGDRRGLTGVQAPDNAGRQRRQPRCIRAVADRRGRRTGCAGRPPPRAPPGRSRPGRARAPRRGPAVEGTGPGRGR